MHARAAPALALLSALACGRGGGDGGAGGGRQAGSPAQRPPVPVQVARAEQRDVPRTLAAVGTIEPSNQVGVRPLVPGDMELQPRYQLDPEALHLLRVRSSSGQLVPLDAVGHLAPGVGPLSVSHTGQLPSVTISFNLDPSASLGAAVSQVQAVAGQVLPPNVSTRFQGIADAFQASLSGLGWLLLLAVVVIYLVLGILYESYVHPVTILTALPFAGFGALLTLLVFRTELSLYAFVGVIMLVGLVKKNGIMMVDFAIEERRRGRTPREAIYDACRIRFRPITMTTLAALAGTLPIALGLGAGAESRRPLGLAVVGGLLFSQALTLFVTPVFYTYLERFSQWSAERRHRRAARRQRPGGAAADRAAEA